MSLDLILFPSSSQEPVYMFSKAREIYCLSRAEQNTSSLDFQSKRTLKYVQFSSGEMPGCEKWF